MSHCGGSESVITSHVMLQVLLFTLSLLEPGWAANTLEAFRRVYGGSPTMRVQVEKTLKLELTGREKVQKGTFYRKKKMFLLDLEGNPRQRIVHSGDKLISLVESGPTSAQVFEWKDPKAALDQAVLFRILDLSRPLSELFQIEEKEKGRLFLLKDIQSGQEYRLQFDEKRRLKSLFYREEDINSVELRFSGWRSSVPLEDRIFHISVPAHARRIQQ